MNTFYQKLNLSSKALDQDRLDYRLILRTSAAFQTSYVLRGYNIKGRAPDDCVSLSLY